VSDNSLIVEASLTPVVFGGSSPLTYTEIGCQEMEWQYMDNVTLTPEPASLALLALSVVPLIRRRG
jgi:hypothetical protein